MIDQYSIDLARLKSEILVRKFLEKWQMNFGAPAQSPAMNVPTNIMAGQPANTPTLPQFGGPSSGPEGMLGGPQVNLMPKARGA